MSQILVALLFWLHALATVVFIGHFLLLYLIYLPVLTSPESADGRGAILSQISKRSRPWLYTSLLILLVTGSYLTFADPNYLGFANFGNIWGFVMLVKHILILGMIAVGFWFNAILRVGPMLSSKSGAAQAMSRLRLYTGLLAVSGILVLLLTSIAQTE